MSHHKHYTDAVALLPRWDAAKLLDGLAKNNWRKP
jgi:hypothetical protein